MLPHRGTNVSRGFKLLYDVVFFILLLLEFPDRTALCYFNKVTGMSNSKPSHLINLFSLNERDETSLRVQNMEDLKNELISNNIK